MCGIVGGFGVDTEPKALEQSMQCLAHRGPDGEGFWSSDKHQAWLGHRRLAIVDLTESGIQPMTNESSTLRLVCNGEIYNYPALRRELESAGHRFSSHSDSEVLLHAYEQWGDAMLDRLEGMFAFALWDDPRGRLLAARDRIGMKPLFFAETNGGVVIASTLAPINAVLPGKPEFEPMAMAYTMTLGYVPAPHTVWKGIAKLHPAHLLTWSADKGVSTRAYWHPPDTIAGDAGDPLAVWSKLFPEVLEEHLLSDVPIALFLSAGLDSTAVAAGLQNLDQRVQTLTLGFPGSQQDESQAAARTADFLGFEHRTLPILTNDMSRLLEQVTQQFEEPHGHTSLLNMWAITQAVSGHFKVALSGNGGDEVFGGYKWYQNLDAPLDRTAATRRALLKAIGGTLPYRFAHRQATSVFRNLSILHRHAWRHFARFLPEEAEVLFGDAGLSFGEEEMLEPMRRYYVHSLPALRALQRVDLMTFCTYADLAKMDFAGMAHAVEVRTPFLDRRIIEWAFTQPLVPASAAPKQLLRDYLKSRGISNEILNHPKRGFSFKAFEQFDIALAIREIENGYWVREGVWPKHWKQIANADVPQKEARLWVLLNLTRWASRWQDSNGT